MNRRSKKTADQLYLEARTAIEKLSGLRRRRLVAEFAPVPIEDIFNFDSSLLLDELDLGDELPTLDMELLDPGADEQALTIIE